MSQMRVATRTEHFYPPHPKGVILMPDNAILFQGVKERWPPAATIKLCGGVKKWRTTRRAGIDPLAFVIPELPRKRPLRPSLPKHFVLLWS